jgi:hypothetical protein
MLRKKTFSGQNFELADARQNGGVHQEHSQLGYSLRSVVNWVIKALRKQ